MAEAYLSAEPGDDMEEGQMSPPRAVRGAVVQGYSSGGASSTGSEMTA